MPYLDELGLNSRVLIFAAVVSAFAATLFSLTPALRLSSMDVREGIVEGGRGSAGKVWRRIGSRLVVLELTTAVVLLVGAGLLSKSFYRLLQVSTGFETERLITMRVTAPRASYLEDEKAVALGRQVVTQLNTLPGVKAVALTSTLPVTFNANTTWIRFAGRPYNGEHNEANERVVGSDYFAALEAKILQGRTFLDSDSNVSTMTERVNNSPSVYLRRSSTWLVGGFAAVALLLAIVGLYGVIAYSVSQRTREIGVRIALGAQRGTVYGLILKEAGVLALAGIVIGLACSVLAASLMRKLLFGTPPWDVATLGGVAGVLGVAALLASYLPARRAASVDPIKALRAE